MQSTRKKIFSVKHCDIVTEDSDLSIQGSSAPSVAGSGSTLRGEGSTQQLMGSLTSGGTARRKGGISFIDGADFPDYVNNKVGTCIS